MKTVRIFISSPGDVGAEREKAREIFDRLQTEFSGVLEIAPYFWESDPIRAHADPQSQIEPPSKFDVFVCLLWARLGSKLHPGLHRKADGGEYASGTEYEVLDALEGWRRSQAPQVLVYKRKTDPVIPVKPKDEREKVISQYDALQDFVARLTKEGEFFVRGSNSYAGLDQFEEKFETHMRKVLEGFLDPGVVASRHVPKSWTKGSPFRGLRHFDFEHAAIFFGRTRAIEEVLDALKRQAMEERAFVLVFGGSGVGKSSLVRAGVLPWLVKPGVIDGVGLWRRAVMRPSEVNEGDLFDALAAALMRAEGLPEIGSDGTSISRLATMLREKPDGVGMLIKGALSQAARETQIAEKLEKQPRALFALAIDQLEELFTVERLAGQREGFLRSIDALARSGYVWVLATLRSDFYARCEESTLLMELKKGAGQYHLQPPDEVQLGQMIRRPTAAAGLSFEENHKSGERLDDLLRDAAVENPAALPLLEFVLEELYEQRDKEKGLLTLQAYRTLGGVEGALGKRAEESFQSAGEAAQQSFDPIFRQLVTISTTEGEPPVRRRARKDDIETTDGPRELIARLTEDRLLVADKSEEGIIVVGLAHEAVLTSWTRLAQWVEQNRETLKSRAQVTIDADRWVGNNRNPDYLYGVGLPLERAKKLLAEHFLDESEREFVFEASAHAEKSARLRAKRLKQIASVFALLAVVAGAAAFWAVRNSQRVRQSASRSEFTTAMELLQKDHGDQALAHLARAVRLDSKNSAAIWRLYSLLGQRSWPLLLRSYPNLSPARTVRLLPDQKRLLFGCSGEEGNFERKNVSSVQIMDWTNNRLLAAPANESQHSVESVTLSSNHRMAGIQLGGKAGTEYAYFLSIPECDAPAVTIDDSKELPEVEQPFKVTDIRCFSPDGSFAFVNGVWREQTEDGDQFGCSAVVPTINNLSVEDRRVHVVFLGKKPSAPVFNRLSQRNWTFLNSRPNEVLAARFDGQKVLLVLDDGDLYRFEPERNLLSKSQTLNQTKAVPLLGAAFAEQAPLIALLGRESSIVSGGSGQKDEALEIVNWQNGVRFAGPAIASAHSKSSVGNTPAYDYETLNVALRFGKNDEALFIEQETYSEPKTLSACSVWEFKSAAEGSELKSLGSFMNEESFLTGLTDETEVFLFDREGNRLCEPLHHESKVLSAALASEHLFATGSENGFVRVWTRLVAPFKSPTRSTAVEPGHYDGALAESHDGSKLYADYALLGSNDWVDGEPVVGWIQRSDQKVKIAFGRWEHLYGGNFDTSGSRLAAFGGSGFIDSTNGAFSQGACIFDAVTGRRISPLLPHADCSWAAFDPTGRWIATIGGNYIQFWDAHSFQPSGPRLVDNGGSWGAWNPVYPRRFFSVADDGTMKIWNLDNQTILHQVASTQPSDQSDESAEQKCFNSLIFNATGDRFALRRGIIGLPWAANRDKTWAGTIAFGDAESGSVLTDPVSVGFGSLRLTYEESLGLVDWPKPPSDPSDNEVLVLASTAEALGGYCETEDGSLEFAADRASLFRALPAQIERVPANSVVAQLARSFVGTSEIQQMLAEDQDKLARNAAEGRAAYHLAEVERGLWPAPSTWQSSNTDHDDLIGRIGYEYAEDEDLREARRISPEGADRMMHGIVENLRRRSDPVATFFAIDFGARDPEIIHRARDFLQKLKMEPNASGSEGEVEEQENEADDNDRANRERILKEWERKLGDL